MGKRYDQHSDMCGCDRCALQWERENPGPVCPHFHRRPERSGEDREGGVVERPILFSAPMVRALLAGTKTQTRRTIKLKTGDAFDEKACVGAIQEWRPVFDKVAGKHVGRESAVIRCPYGVPGDTLWVRESGLESTRTKTFRMFRHDASEAAGGNYWVDSDGGRYGAGYGPAITRESQLAAGGWRVRPSIHMPRWASRITLKITDVRVERLNEISEADARAEGIADLTSPDGARGVNVKVDGKVIGNWIAPRSRDIYETLWEHINGPGSWDANPWVWAVSFEVVK